MIVLFLLACDLDAERDRVGFAERLTGGNVDRGVVALETYGCGSCHRIPNVPGATSAVGPPLDRFARRAYVAGRFPNTPDELERWIESPQERDPGTAMPDMQVTREDAIDMAAYLYTLD
jgi:cytochrome c